jgi:hypothetical protein
MRRVVTNADLEDGRHLGRVDKDLHRNQPAPLRAGHPPASWRSGRRRTLERRACRLPSSTSYRGHRDSDTVFPIRLRPPGQAQGHEAWGFTSPPARAFSTPSPWARFVRTASTKGLVVGADAMTHPHLRGLHLRSSATGRVPDPRAQGGRHRPARFHPRGTAGAITHMPAGEHARHPRDGGQKMHYVQQQGQHVQVRESSQVRPDGGNGVKPHRPLRAHQANRISTRPRSVRLRGEGEEDPPLRNATAGNPGPGYGDRPEAGQKGDLLLLAAWGRVRGTASGWSGVTEDAR